MVETTRQACVCKRGPCSISALHHEFVGACACEGNRSIGDQSTIRVVLCSCTSMCTVMLIMRNVVDRFYCPGSQMFSRLRFFNARLRDDDIDRTINMLAEDLSRLGIDYTIIGGNALKVHGFYRFTIDVDVLLPKKKLAQRGHKIIC